MPAQTPFPAQTFSVYAFYEKDGWLAIEHAPITTIEEAAKQIDQANNFDIQDIRVFQDDFETTRRDVTEDVCLKAIETVYGGCAVFAGEVVSRAAGHVSEAA